MSATVIQDALPGEDLVGIEPELLQQVDPGWLHRLNLYPGRALTAPALQSEQLYRAGRLAILGQCVTQGVVKGLEVSADLSKSDPLLQVAPGYGISAAGEDVALLSTLSTTLGSLLVIDPGTGSAIAPFPQYIQDKSNNNFAGVLLLQPIVGQVGGETVDTGTGPIVVSGNLNASCDQDPEEYAFEDWQIVDGVRLVLVAWPSSPATLILPSVNPAQTWRNRLAYTIFNAEMNLAPDDRLPWDMLGVPVALVGFDSSWNAQFVDKSAVVRVGGLARSRYTLPALSGGGPPLLVQPALAQARVLQLSEHLSALFGAPPPYITNFSQAFAFLPPCGVLPASALDFVKHVAPLFPPNWTLDVGPVHQEEIETALLTSMTALPLDVTQNESVQVLVPLPDAVYDPEILLTETVDPAFEDAVEGAEIERDGVLQHRKAIQLEANALSQALTGTQQAPPYDPDAGLSTSEIAARDAQLYLPAASEQFGTLSTPVNPGANQVTCTSNDIQSLLTTAQNYPYTLTQDSNGNPISLTLFSQDDLNDMAQNGLQHFINRISAKLNSANDLLDLAFLTAQSDIYRFRQFVLGATDATQLAVSPIVANIATGVSAAATATNLQNYLSSLLPATTTTPAPTTTAPVAASGAAGTLALKSSVRSFALEVQTPAAVSVTGFRFSAPAATVSKFSAASTAGRALAPAAASAAAFTQITPGTAAQPATTNDVLGQSPLVGAQLNVRTLTIAERLANPPSQDGIFYSIGNRVAILQLLADLEITLDDIQILVDQWPPTPPATTTTLPPTLAVSTPPLGAMPTFAYFKANPTLVLSAVQTPFISAPSGSDPDEASLFSTGIHILEQHSSLLRAVEGRIAQYSDFLTLCNTALGNIQNDLPQAQTLIAQLDNDLAQARQDLAFTTALLNDEIQRVDGVNAQRAQTLQNVPIVAFTRPSTLDTDADVPSRQLVPGNIASPVPSCLQQSVAIPPELREIVALLREAPVNWMPSIQDLLNKLERPTVLQAVAVDAQARASMLLQVPLRASSAASEPGVYAPVIASIYSANQQAVRVFQAQRSAFQPVQLVNQSWASQVQTLQSNIAVGDLLASDSVHAEVVNATSRLMQQISGVATCLYTRAGQTLPIDRLAWAEFLRGLGLSMQLQSLAVLPNWTTLDYVSRQQMQMLVDWLFQQIDTTNSSAVAFMSDVVRVAILLASDAPVDGVITGAVTLAATPKVGGVISLTLPSDRIAHGMYVQLYSAAANGALAAQAVVTDLDSASVKATVTQVYQTVALQANDVARFSALSPQTPAVRAFDM
jgi:hypothetical protein